MHITCTPVKFLHHSSNLFWPFLFSQCLKVWDFSWILAMETKSTAVNCTSYTLISLSDLQENSDYIHWNMDYKPELKVISTSEGFFTNWPFYAYYCNPYSLYFTPPRTFIVFITHIFQSTKETNAKIAKLLLSEK